MHATDSAEPIRLAVLDDREVITRGVTPMLAPSPTEFAWCSAGP